MSVLLCYFCGQKYSMQQIFIQKCFMFAVGSVCSVKRFTTGSRNCLKDIRNPQMMLDEVRKWLRQQSKDFYAAGFDALTGKVTRQVYQCSWRICREINYFSMFEYHTFYVLYPFVTYLLTSPSYV
jgi:hypothetical protein